MNRWTGVIIFITFLYTGNVNAAAGDQFLLPKFGLMSIDLKDADPLISYGFMYGFGMSANVSFEAEFNSGFSGGEYSITDADGVETSSGFYRVRTIAGYLVHRMPFEEIYYIKSKLGLLNENVEVTVEDPDPLADDRSNTSVDTDVAVGFGLGASLGVRLTLEFEVTAIDRDIIFYSLGTHYRF